MKLKKVFTSFLSGVLAFTIIAGISSGSFTESEKVFNVTNTVSAANQSMRRPCSSEQPMLIVHIDTWNYADPAKIIALIPEDIKPYVVFNISLSINWDRTNHKWLMVQNGYECAKSWLRTCADEGVWTMIQPASGGQCHFPDYPANYDFDNSLFGEFFKDYPNFLGFNYSEQFWGFESTDFPVTPLQRYQHFAGLLKLCNKYGGYLDINWCANRWSAPLNPVAMLKKCPEWRSACENYSQNYILEEKYTQGSFIEDVESEVFGAYVSGYCGNFGVRYDETGWTDRSNDDKPLSSKDQYRVSTSLPIHLERMAFNGATVIDGPELIWADDFKELYGKKDNEGYNQRAWGMHDQYQNAVLDFFRKVTDGTIRVPSREEVIDRTKIVITQNNNNGDDHNKYSTYQTLFEGLYRMPGDGNFWDNTNLFKCTGRYPTIPTVFSLRDDLAKSFEIKLNQSELPSRWSSISQKQAEFNTLFPQEYTGDCYAARYENSWVTYNPYKTGKTSSGKLSLKYSTCSQLECIYSAYASGFIKEYGDHIDIYLNNYDEDAKTTLKTNSYKITGCNSKPSFTYKDRGVNQTKSNVTESYSNGTYTLTVNHNGPVEISIKCSGNETNKLTSYKTAKLIAPPYPDAYTGIRQYEGEFFDNKNIEGIVANACNSGVSNIQGQGFIKFGKNGNAAVKDTVTTKKPGEFTFKLRYSSTSNSNNIDLYVNKQKIETMNLSNSNSYSNWNTYEKKITLSAGKNDIELKANSALSSSVYFDNFTVSGNFVDPGTQTTPVTPSALSGKLIKDLAIGDTVNSDKWSITDKFAQGSVLFGDRDFTCTSLPDILSGTEAIKTACDSKTVLSDLGTFTAAKDITVYVGVDSRITSQLPSWLTQWQNSGLTALTSNELKLVFYNKKFKSGEKVTLGTNGGSTECVNYIVLASESQTKLKGDVNADGVLSVTDLVMFQKYLLNSEKLTNSQAGDIDENGTITIIDFIMLKSIFLN